MKKINRLKGATLAAACAALIITTGSLKADFHPPVNILPIHANAGVTAVLTPTSDPLIFIATATGVVQTTLLGTCVENAQIFRGVAEDARSGESPMIKTTTKSETTKTKGKT